MGTLILQDGTVLKGKSFGAIGGFEGEIVDNALKDVGINIFLKNEMASDPNPNVQSYAERQSNKSGHDNTRVSLCDGPFLNKRQFVQIILSDQHIWGLWKKNVFVKIDCWNFERYARIYLN